MVCLAGAAGVEKVCEGEAIICGCLYVAAGLGRRGEADRSWGWGGRREYIKGAPLHVAWFIFAFLNPIPSLIGQKANSLIY
jgi:hypothetical protein